VKLVFWSVGEASPHPSPMERVMLLNREKILITSYRLQFPVGRKKHFAQVGIPPSRKALADKVIINCFLVKNFRFFPVFSGTGIDFF